MTAQPEERTFQAHLVIYETPDRSGRTAVPVRISQQWTVVTGHASPATVWALFAAASQ